MTGLFNYSGNAGLRRSCLHNRTFDGNKNIIMHLRNVCVCGCGLMGLCGRKKRKRNVHVDAINTAGLTDTNLYLYYFEPPLKGSEVLESTGSFSLLHLLLMKLCRLSFITSGWSQPKNVTQSFLTSMESLSRHPQVFQVRHTVQYIQLHLQGTHQNII